MKGKITMYSKTTTVVNPSGLHARPASLFVEEAKKFSSRVTVRTAAEGTDDAVNAKSIVLLLTLGIGPGTEVEISANGEDEAQAVESLVTLIQSGFGE